MHILSIECPECHSEEDFASFKAETSRTLMPYCSVIIDNDEIYAETQSFDDLQGVKLAETFKEIKELPLSKALQWLGNHANDFEDRGDDHKSPYKQGDSIEDMGHCITIGLSRNNQNWVLFNLAAIYWRIEGNAFEAIECSRRSYHFAPAKYKDIPLLNMANVLHNHGYTKNATMIMRKAEKINPKQALHHFTLGNMFAYLEDYSSAIYHYKQALEIQSDFIEASQRLFAVLCQAKLHHKLEQQHESLKKTLEELRKFKHKQDQYRERSDRLESRMEEG